MRRREFIAGLGGAAVSPLTAGAQQVPVIGFLQISTSEGYPEIYLTAFYRGLADQGYAVGRNVAIEYRWADGQYDRLPELALDLVRRNVAVLYASGGTPIALVAAATTKAIPIVFFAGADPVADGLVMSLARPGGNATGVASLTYELHAKRIETLHAAVPMATAITFLTNPASQYIANHEAEQAQLATKVLGLDLVMLNARTPSDIEAAFAALSQRPSSALVVGGDSFFVAQREQLAALAARHGIPAIYYNRINVMAGGLMSYGADLRESQRVAGNYVGRILNGEKPADLPVQRATKIELVINMKTAKGLGLTLPITLLGRADEVIE